jgi:argininosuccinate lyase
MEAMRESWTDARLDDLNGKVDELGRRMDNGFNRVDADVRALRVEMNARFERVDERFDALQRTLLQIAGGTVATLIAGFAGIIVTQL